MKSYLDYVNNISNTIGKIAFTISQEESIKSDLNKMGIVISKNDNIGDYVKSNKLKPHQLYAIKEAIHKYCGSDEWIQSQLQNANTMLIECLNQERAKIYNTALIFLNELNNKSNKAPFLKDFISDINATLGSIETNFTEDFYQNSQISLFKLLRDSTIATLAALSEPEGSNDNYHLALNSNKMSTFINYFASYLPTKKVPVNTQDLDFPIENLTTKFTENEHPLLLQIKTFYQNFGGLEMNLAYELENITNKPAVLDAIRVYKNDPTQSSFHNIITSLTKCELHNNSPIIFNMINRDNYNKLHENAVQPSNSFRERLADNVKYYLGV